MQPSIFVDALLYKTRVGLKAEISRFALHFLWWIANPLLSMGVYYVIFGVFLDRGTENFALFLLCGIVHWEWFVKSITGASNSIVLGRTIVTQIKIPKFFFPLEVILREIFKFFFAQCLLFIFLICNGFMPTTLWLYYPLLLLVQTLLIVGVALFCAAIVPFCEDLKMIIDTILRLVFFASGIFWDLSKIVSEKYLDILYFNPLAGLIQNYRNVLIDHTGPDFSYLLYVTGFGLVFGIAAFSLSHFLHEEYVRKWYQ